MFNLKNKFSKKTVLAIICLTLLLIFTLLLTTYLFTPYSGSLTPGFQALIDKYFAKTEKEPKIITVGDSAKAIQKDDQVIIIEYNLTEGSVTGGELDGQMTVTNHC